MPLNARLDLLPSDAIFVGDSLAIQRDEERIVFFNAAGPIFVCQQDDRTSIRVAAVTVIENGWAKQGQLAEALGLDRSTLYRDRRKFQRHGIDGLAAKRRGPKQAHTLTPKVAEEAQKLLDRGFSMRATAARIGMSHRGLHHGIARGLVRRPTRARSENSTHELSLLLILVGRQPYAHKAPRRSHDPFIGQETPIHSALPRSPNARHTVTLRCT